MPESTTKTGQRDARGRFQRGATGNPGGRPKRADELRRLFDGDAEAVAKKVLEAASSGDMQACRLVIERLLPAIRPAHAPVTFAIDPSAPLAEQGRAVLAAVAAGELPPDQGRSLLDGIASLARITEIDELAARIAKLEEITDA